jgi:hypothetical protein
LLAVTLALWCGACASMNPFAKKSFTLTLEGGKLDEVASVFLIVGDAPALKDASAADSAAVARLVRLDVRSQYRSLAQFNPAPDPKAAWQQMFSKPENTNVSYKVKGSNLSIDVERDLLETNPQSAIGVVVDFGAAGWRGFTIGAEEIKAKDDHAYAIDGHELRSAPGK